MAIEPITSINTNISAQRATRVLVDSTVRLQTSIARASSGLRITSPEVDAAGLAQFIQLDAQLSRLSAVDSNLANAVSFSETQSGYLQQAQSALDRMGELSILAQDPTKSPSDLAALQQEFGQLQSSVSDIGTKQFNGVDLFPAAGAAVTTDSEGATMTLGTVDFAASGGSGGLADVFGGIAISTPSSAAAALGTIVEATQNLGNLRATVGANLQSLGVTRESNAALSENLSVAGIRIVDADIA